MKTIRLTCAACNVKFDKQASQYKAVGGKYCSKKCTGIGRRKNLTKEQKAENKRLYDIEYRAKNLAKIKAAKRENHLKNYDPVKWSKIRRTDAYRKRHKAYLNTPEYKEWKKNYDRNYLSTKKYGEEWKDCHHILLDLEDHIKTVTTKYEIRLQNQTFNKAQRRIRNGTTQRGYA